MKLDIEVRHCSCWEWHHWRKTSCSYKKCWIGCSGTAH